MSTANKYHGSGRLYTTMELRQRRYAAVKTSIVLGYRGQGLEAPVVPYRRTEPRRHEGR